MGDEVLIKASIDTLSQAACLHLVHLKFFLFFFLAVLQFVCVCPLVPSASLTLLCPSVFPR